MKANFPRTILPKGFNDTARMHKRTQHLTEYVELNVGRFSRIVVGERIKARSPRQKAFEATFRGKDHSFLIVPAANGWANVSDTLKSVSHALIVTFDTPISSLRRGQAPKKVRVYSVPSKKMLDMRKRVESRRPDSSRSQSVSVPVFTDIAQNTENQQAVAGALEPFLTQLWESEIEWAKNEKELSYRPDPVNQLLDQMQESGKSLRIDFGKNTLLLDPSQVSISLV
jgi:hypothetical protein